MTIQGNDPLPAAIQAAAATLAAVLGKCCGPSAENAESAEVENDILTYRKTTTVVDVEVRLPALTEAGVTIIQAISAAIRGPERNQEERIADIEALRARTAKTPTSDAAWANNNEHLEAYLKARRTAAILDVFGSAIDEQSAKLAVDAQVERLVRVAPSGAKSLDPEGLADAVAQLVAMVPRAAVAHDITLHGKLYGLVEAFVPTEYIVPVSLAISDALDKLRSAEVNPPKSSREV